MKKIEKLKFAFSICEMTKKLEGIVADPDILGPEEQKLLKDFGVMCIEIAAGAAVYNKTSSLIDKLSKKDEG